ncbi:phage terminase small subunit P27 family [Magnetococcus sp. PR-3]|uniref:phage terminase small subunit P27 family n=1 Tax=Magnetococcus sp. PR-3 TaxID=3120355 RepID=UPI002FCE0DDA
MSGPAKQSLKLEIVKGNPGKRGLLNQAKKAKKGGTPIEGAPKWLDSKARRTYADLVKALQGGSILDKIDRTALVLLCDALSEYRDAREFVRENGTSYETETKDGAIMHRIYPQVGQAADAWRRVKSMLTEFGLTPVSRTRLLGVIGDDTGDENPFDRF